MLERLKLAWRCLTGPKPLTTVEREVLRAIRRLGDLATMPDVLEVLPEQIGRVDAYVAVENLEVRGLVSEHHVPRDAGPCQQVVHAWRVTREGLAAMEADSHDHQKA